MTIVAWFLYALPKKLVFLPVASALTGIHRDSLPYSRKFWRGIKFGGLVVNLCNRQIKIHQYFILTYIHVAIQYRTAKFKSANIFAMTIWGPTAKFNSRQYFPLYGMFFSLNCQRYSTLYLEVKSFPLTFRHGRTHTHIKF